MKTQSFLLLGWLLLATTAAMQAQFNYTTNNGTITITAYTGTNANVVIPSTIDGLPVTSLETNAFPHNLTSVTIPDSVTSIGDSEFSFNVLTAITVDSANQNYSSIGGVLFDKGQTTLIQYPSVKAGASYTIPNSVTSIGDSAFYDCSRLTSVTIPNRVTSIGESTFGGCSSLTNVTIGTGVTTIGAFAFSDSGDSGYVYGCPLMNITIPNSVTNIGTDAFAGCTKLAHVTLGNGVTSIGKGTFSSCSSLTSVTIPASVTSIGISAFAGSGLRKVTIPNSVTSIGDSTFQGCDSLTSVTIPNSVTNIGNYAFNDVPYFEPDGPTINPGWGLSTVTIPNSVTSIGNGAFGGTSPTNVMIPCNVKNIGEGPFADCSFLKAVDVDLDNDFFISIDGVLFDKNRRTLIQFPAGSGGGSYTIPDSVTSISDRAFAGCSLTNIAIPKNFTNIGHRAFYHCPSLISITIPNTVTNIENGAFSNCDSLTSVYFQGNAPTADDSAFDSQFVGHSGPDPAIVYYLPGTSGWTHSDGFLYGEFAELPTALWLPQIQTTNTSVGSKTNRFGFSVNWASGMSGVVEAATDLANPVWSPLATNGLSGGTFQFTDPELPDHPRRFYRVRSQ